jgi:hypothetical protein
MRERDYLDHLLDSALSSYADAQADSGLEQRILTHVNDARMSLNNAATARRRWLMWAIALPAVACLLLLVFTMKRAPVAGLQPKAHQLQQAGVGAHQQKPSAAMHPLLNPPARGSAVHPNHRAVGAPAVSAPPPKLDIFPTPQPLTREEQAFAIYVARAPESERRALAQALEHQQEPMRVSAINIPPIKPISDGGN